MQFLYFLRYAKCTGPEIVFLLSPVMSKIGKNIIIYNILDTLSVKNLVQERFKDIILHNLYHIGILDFGYKDLEFI